LFKNDLSKETLIIGSIFADASPQVDFSRFMREKAWFRFTIQPFASLYRPLGRRFRRIGQT
jgi:predicted membrane-bound mannosyltransferase